MWDPIFNLCFKFGANACNNGQVMAKNLIFNMAAAAILDFVRYELWVKKLSGVRGPYSPRLYLIWCKSVQKWWSYCRLTDFQMAADAILDLCTM